LPWVFQRGLWRWSVCLSFLSMCLDDDDNNMTPHPPPHRPVCRISPLWPPPPASSPIIDPTTHPPTHCY
jgi:hypothetical protein